MRRNLSTRKAGEVLRVLPGGPAGTLIATGALSGSYGEVLTFARASTGACINSSNLISTLTSGQPRVAPTGLMIERAATNIFLRSEEVANGSWQNTGGGTVTATDAVAPDGATTAARFTEGSTTTTHGRFQSFTYAAATTYTMSAYVKAGTLRYMTLGFTNDTVQPAAKYDIQAGTVLATFGSATATITAVGSDWYRITCTGSPLAAASFPEFWTETDGTASVNKSHAGNTANYFWIWGLQLEVGQFATSYVKTTTTTATRVVETATIPNPLVSGNNTWSLEATITGTSWPATAGNFILQIGTSYAGNNTATLRLEDGATARVILSTFDNNGLDKSVTSTAAINTGTHKVKGVNNNGTLSLYVDDVLAASTGSGLGSGILTTMPADIRIGGQNSSGGAPLNGTIHSISISK